MQHLQVDLRVVVIIIIIIIISKFMINITKTYLYNFDPLKPHFYIVKNIRIFYLKKISFFGGEIFNIFEIGIFS